MRVPTTRQTLMDLVPSQGQADTRPGFKETLQDFVNKVDGLQHEAHESMDALAVGKSSNIHETMMAIQKAEVSFKMMMQVRNKIMNAYQEVMRMQV